MRRFLDWHMDAKRRLGLPALDRPFTHLVAALGFACVLWVTLFAAMDVLHPGIALRDRLGVTLLSVVLAMATGWLVLAEVLWHAPVACGPGSSAAPARPRGKRERRRDRLSRALSREWHRSRSGHGLAAASLLAVALCGLDIIAAQGVPLQTAAPAPRTLAPIMLMPNIPPGPPIEASAMLSRPAPSRRLDLREASAAAGRAVAGAAPRRNSAPTDIAALATEIATAQRLDPRLVLAVIATESDFQADAISPGNAQGLMQVTPETARRFGVSNLLDPAENIRAGTRYLRWLLSYFEGDLSLALAAYNAGEGAVLRHGGVPPFAETRLYLQRVRSLYPAERHPF